MKRVVKAVIVVLFLGTLAGLLLVRRAEMHSSQPNVSKVDPKGALDHHGFYLEEVSRSAGINFVHQAPTLDHKLDHIMPLVASMGAAVSIVDFDRDGWDDIYVCNSGEGSKNALYRNMH
ncbi:MAG TPA: CRTAC1 family protein, partial [Candidatus Angelobacter sp.]